MTRDIRKEIGSNRLRDLLSQIENKCVDNSLCLSDEKQEIINNFILFLADTNNGLENPIKDMEYAT